MATVTSSVTPFFSTNALTSPELRWALAAAFAKDPAAPMSAEQGVLPNFGDAAAVPTSNGTSGAPSVSVAPFQCIIQRPTGGTYVCTWPAAQTVALNTPLPASGQTRIDLLVAEVVDPEADAGTITGTGVFFQVRTVAGTPASSPSAPSVPSGTIPLWQWTVSNAGAITAITSRRQWTRSPGGVRLVENGDTRAGSHPGDLRIFRTGQVDAYISGAWVPIVAPSAWTQVNVAYTYAGGGGRPAGTASFGSTGFSFCRYKRAGNDLTISYEARWGGTGGDMGVGAITTVLPNGWVTPAGRDQWIPCHLWVNDSASGVVNDWGGLALVQASSNILRPYFPWNIGAQITGIAPWKVANSTGVPGASCPYIAGGFAQGGTVHCGPATIELAP